MIRILSTGLLAVLLCACQAAPEPEPPRSPAAPATTAIEPALTVDTLDHGRFDLAAQRGHWVVVNYWATWCGPCIKEMPELDAFDRSRDDVAVIGLAYEETTAADLRAFLGKHPVAYPLAIIDPFAPPADFETPRGLPTTWLIGPDGKVVEHFIGPVDGARLTAAIQAASVATH